MPLEAGDGAGETFASARPGVSLAYTRKRRDFGIRIGDRELSALSPETYQRRRLRRATGGAPVDHAIVEPPAEGGRSSGENREPTAI